MNHLEEVSQLLSPPTSPRMSGTPPSHSNANWQDYQPQRQRLSLQSSKPGGHPLSPVKEDPTRRQLPSSEGRPLLLRSHKSFPYTSGAGAHNFPHQQSPLSRTTDPATFQVDADLSLSQAGYTELNRSDPVLSSHGDSAPQSPNPGLSPTSVDADLEESNEDGEDEGGLGMSDEEDEEEGHVEGEGEKTAAERRAEKRKMKRFRLTHNQTRFLMSEFTRQAHPDAAHRERLSKEIPGLSPRQVQVWFQNRRAKLKRLTSDDRERMLKSRALPEDFDMTQALHSPYVGQQAMGTPLGSPVTYLPYGEAGVIRPLAHDGMRRQSEDESTNSPISIGSAYGNFFTPPGSAPTSENLSPISATSERGHFGGIPHSQSTSPRYTNPFVRSSSFSTAYHPNPHIPRLHLQDRMVRNRAESLGSPLRSSMSYTGNALDYGGSQPATANLSPAYDMSMQPGTEHHIPQPVPESAAHPYGLGYQNPQFQGFQSSALARGRPIPGHFPTGIQIRQDYRHSTGVVPTQPQQQVFSGLQSAPLAAPQDYNISQHHDPYLASTYGGSYSSDQATHSSSSLSLPLHLSHNVEGESEQQGDIEGANTGLQPAFVSGVRGPYQGPGEYSGPQQ